MLFPSNVVEFSITEEDKRTARLETAQRTASGGPVYAEFTVNAVAQALMRLGFKGVSAFMPSHSDDQGVTLDYLGYVTLWPTCDIKRLPCRLDIDGDDCELTFSFHWLYEIQREYE
jgi:hypothetical protein